MAILTDGISSDGFGAGRIKIWRTGDFLGQASGMNYLNPASCSINASLDRVELSFPSSPGGGPHGSSHLSTGTDPIPAGNLDITGVTSDFQVAGSLGVGTMPTVARDINVKSDSTARIYVENDGTAAFSLEVIQSTDPNFPNILVIEGVNTSFTYFCGPLGFLFSTQPLSLGPNICYFSSSEIEFYVPLKMQGDIHLENNTLYLDPDLTASISYVAASRLISFSWATEILGRLEINGALTMRGGAGTYLGVPAMTTAERPTVPEGSYGIIFNTETNQFEGWNGENWVILG
jgi:hypothetical protein